MNFAKKVLITMGVVALACTLVSLLAPKTAHAFVAALVQITNTVSTPVPTAEALGTASLLNAKCSIITTAPSFKTDCYMVPNDTRAVIEHIDGSCSAPSGTVLGGMTLSISSETVPAIEHIHPLHLDFDSAISGTTTTTFSVPLRDYADPGATFTFTGLGDPSGATIACSAYGRLVPTH